MDYLFVLLTERDAPEDPSVYPDMGRFAMELAAKGKLRGGSPLHPESEGTRVRTRSGKPIVTDGPFSETKEVIGGYFLIDCESQEEAMELAKQCPHNRIGVVEVREVIPMGGPPA